MEKLVFTDARNAFNDLQSETPTFQIKNFQTWIKTTQNTGSSISLKTKSWYTHANVCVDGSDGVQYVREVGNYTTDMQTLGLHENVSTRPLMPRPLEIEKMEGNSRIYLLKGNTALLHCWRSFRPTPLHFLLGYGALYSAIRANQFNQSLDNVVFHQCPAPFDGGDFFTSFWRILYRFGTDRGIFSSTTRFFSIGKSSPMFCMEVVLETSMSLLTSLVGISVISFHLRRIFTTTSRTVCTPLHIRSEDNIFKIMTSYTRAT